MNIHTEYKKEEVKEQFSTIDGIVNMIKDLPRFLSKFPIWLWVIISILIVGLLIIFCFAFDPPCITIHRRT